MSSNPSALEDYVVIRQRIERKLSKPFSVLLHVGVFLLAVLFFLSQGLEFFRTEFIRPEYSGVMVLWSVVLLGHGLFAAFHSGIGNSKREHLVQEELQERLQEEDTQLLTNSRQRFHVQNLLDEDIRRRAGFFIPLTIFLGLNVLTWLSWIIMIARTYTHHWQMSVPLAFVILLPALAVNLWRRKSSDTMLFYRLLALKSPIVDEYPKRKHSQDMSSMPEDDGEFPEEIEERLRLKSNK